MKEEEFIASILNNDLIQFEKYKSDQFPLEDAIYSFTLPKETHNPNKSHSLKLQNLTLLHIAAYSDSLEIFIYIYRNTHLTLRAISGDDYFPLHYACAGGSLEVASFILEKDPEQASLNLHVPYHFIYLAADAGNSQILSLLFKFRANVKVPQSCLNSAISQAIAGCHIECLKLLLKEGSKDNIRTKNFSSIMFAIRQHQPDAVPVLLEYGEDPNVYSDDGECALSLACFLKYTDIVALLCEKIQDINPDPTATYYNQSPVHWGCRSNTPEIMQILIDKGINVNELDKDGNSGPQFLPDFGTPEDNIRILDMLVKNGFDLNLTSPKKVPPKPLTVLESFLTSISRQPDVIEWLINNGANPLQRGALGKRLCNMVKNSPKIEELLKPFKEKAEMLDGKRSLNKSKNH